jgi:hypothetical protein
MSVGSVEEEDEEEVVDDIDEDVTKAAFDNVVENTRCHETQRII